MADENKGVADNEAAVRAAENTQMNEEEQKRADEERAAALKAQEKAVKAGEKQAQTVQMQVVESAESYKAKLYAAAMLEATQMKMDETVPGGLYKDFAGRLVNAKGEVVEASGVDDAKNSGELREKAEVK